MVPFAKSLLRDPALAAMGLVPAGARSDLEDPAVRGVAMRWRVAWISVTLGIIAIVAMFWGTAVSMADTWQSSATYNHGFLVPLISLYLIGVCRWKLSRYEPAPSLWGVVAVVVMAFGWLIGNIASVRAIEQFAFIGMIDALFIAVMGWRAAWAIVFPLIYLMFAVPFGDFLIAPLQDLTAVFVVKALRVMEIPVYLEGIFLAIPTARFEVAEACAGVRFLIATLALGTLFGFLTFRSYRRFAMFLALSFVVPVIANWFRALGIVLIAHYSNSKYAVGADHIIYGWVFFSFVTIILLSIGMMMREKTPVTKAPQEAAIAVPSGRAGSSGAIAGMAILSLVMASAALAYERISLPDGFVSVDAAPALPDIGGGWRAAPGVRSSWHPSFPTADAEIIRSYEKDGRSVQFFIAYYGHQTQGKEIVHNSNRVADGKVWNRAADRTATVKVNGASVDVTVTRMLRGDRGRLAMSWYWVGGRFTGNKYMAKLLQVKSRLVGGPTAAATVVVSAGYEQVPREAEKVLRDFLGHAGPVREMLERTSKN